VCVCMYVCVCVCMCVCVCVSVVHRCPVAIGGEEVEFIRLREGLRGPERDRVMITV
jgi:hypothetical protein